MNGLEIFNSDVFGSIRTIVDKQGEIWFVASDIAKALGYSNTAKAVSVHCKNVEKRTIDVISQDGKSHNKARNTQTMSMIKESDIYRLIVKSKLPSAEKFEAWVFDEVLPTIRKTGSYNNKSNEQQTRDALLLGLFSDDKMVVAQSHKELIELETAPLNEIIQEQTPKVEVYDYFVDKKHTIGFRELRRELESGLNIIIIETTLKQWLHECNMISSIRSTRPTAEAIRLGLMVVKDIMLDNGRVAVQNRFTMAGRDTILQYIQENDII